MQGIRSATELELHPSDYASPDPTPPNVGAETAADIRGEACIIAETYAPLVTPMMGDGLASPPQREAVDEPPVACNSPHTAEQQAEFPALEGHSARIAVEAEPQGASSRSKTDFGPFCDRPGCYKAPRGHSRCRVAYCGCKCRQAMRRVRDRERKWLRRNTKAGRFKRQLEYRARRLARARRAAQSRSPPIPADPAWVT
jgi:hypothetical protein